MEQVQQQKSLDGVKRETKFITLGRCWNCLEKIGPRLQPFEIYKDCRVGFICFNCLKKIVEIAKEKGRSENKENENKGGLENGNTGQ